MKHDLCGENWLETGSPECNCETPVSGKGEGVRCPKDGSACPDDLCHGSGCLQMNGYPMLAECDHCGGLIDEEIFDCSTCTCDDEEDGDWE